MRVRSLASAAAVGALALGMLAQAPAQAMTDNATSDGDAHPAVVALLYVKGGLVFPYCSGMLIAPMVVLTASHCNEGTAEYAVSKGWLLGASNDPEFTDANGDGWIENANFVTVDPAHGVKRNPLYRKGYRDDVTVQLLDAVLPVLSPGAFGTLPRVGLLDDLQKAKTLKGTSMTVVGYGTEAKVTPANTAPAYPDSNERRYAQLPTIALDKQWIHQDQNVGKNPEQAGACYGDSGGPSLLATDEGTFVVGVTSTGDGPCFATNVASRVDTAEALAFVRQFMPK
jgi:secreted trypsin-like serine protease